MATPAPKPSLANITVSGDQATIPLAGPSATVAQLKTLIEDQYQKDKSTLKLALSFNPHADAATLSDVEKEFAQAKVASRISKLGEHLRANLAAKPKDYEDILSRFPFMPIPVAPSKLYLMLRKSALPAQLNAWEVLRHMQIVVEELEKETFLDKAAKRKVMANREETLNSMIEFVTTTYSRLMILPLDDDVVRVFIRENYYTMINVIRIWEFTFMDLLAIPQRYQSAIVAPMELEPRNFDTTGFLRHDILSAYLSVDEMTSDFIKFYESQLKMTLAVPEAMKGCTDPWPNMHIGRVLHEVVRHRTSNVLYLCGNYEICKKHEQKVGEFNKCSKCRWVRYCSRDCQVYHWTTKHKALCMKKLDAAGLEELLKGRRIIISTEEDEMVAKDQQPK